MNAAYGYATLGMLLLAIPFSVIGHFFKDTPSAVVTPIIYLAGFIALGLTGLVEAKAKGVPLLWPSLGGIAVIACMGVLLGLGDYFTIMSFNAGGKIVVVAMIISCMPLVAAGLNVLFGDPMPSWRILAAWAMVAGASVLAREELMANAGQQTRVPAPAAVNDR